MKKKCSLWLAAALALALLTACGAQPQPDSTPASTPIESETPPPEATAAPAVAGAEDMAPVQDVVQEGMEPVYADALKDGVYDITVDSSSSMFKIVACTLTVENGQMTATMTMSGTGYLYVYPGSAEEAAAAGTENAIPFVEAADGAHTYTLPVQALDSGVACAAFSKKKELWYDRTLVFRADSLPLEAFADGMVATAESLGLADGTYTVEVTLGGGSGRASVQSPALLTVENGLAAATIVWGSANYDYMKVDGVQYDAVNTEGNSTFVIPVAGFDLPLAVVADTIAMSTPHEIEYTLTFASATLQAAP